MDKVIAALFVALALVVIGIPMLMLFDTVTGDEVLVPGRVTLVIPTSKNYNLVSVETDCDAFDIYVPARVPIRVGQEVRVRCTIGTFPGSCYNPTLAVEWED